MANGKKQDTTVQGQPEGTPTGSGQPEGGQPEAQPQRYEIPTLEQVRQVLAAGVSERAERTADMKAYRERNDSRARVLVLYMMAQYQQAEPKFAAHPGGADKGFNAFRERINAELVEGLNQKAGQTAKGEASRVWSVIHPKKPTAPMLAALRPFREAWLEGRYDSAVNFNAARAKLAEYKAQDHAKRIADGLKRLLKNKIDESNREAVLTAVIEACGRLRKDTDIFPAASQIPPAPQPQVQGQPETAAPQPVAVGQ